MNKQQIIAIGGGLLRKGETIDIDRYIVKSSNNEPPKVIFIPIASNNLTEYIKVFEREYKKLGAIVETIKLSETTDINATKDQILSSDIIYFGGGNVDILLKWLNKPELNEIIKTAYEQGTIISGLSAGAVVWYEHFIEIVDNEEYVIKKGLGWLDGYCTAHYNKENQKYNDLFHKHQVIGIADNCALHYIGKEITKIIGDKDKCVFKK